MSDQTPDLLRTLLVIVPGSLLFFSVLVVFLAYVRAYLMDIKIGRVYRDGKPHGLLPKHVSSVAFTVLVYSFITVYDTATRLDTELTWRMPVYALANFTGLYSMWTVLRFQRRRYRSASL